jgi:hypothetical protein
MLNANTFANLIKTNLNGVTTASEANQILGDTISSYLLANTVFSFAWAATLPPTPDPVVVASGKFISLVITISPSGATNAVAANEALKNQIVSGMSSATYNIVGTGFTTVPASMSSSATLDNLDLSPSGETDGSLAMINKCQKIIDWVKQLAPTAPVTGTHNPYSGSGTVVSIS